MRDGVNWGRESLRPVGEANRPAGFVKFTFLAPGRVAGWAKILGSSKRLSRPDLPLQLFNLTTPAENMPQHRSEHTGVGKTPTDGSLNKGICSNRTIRGSSRKQLRLPGRQDDYRLSLWA